MPEPDPLIPTAVAELLALQDGVVSRGQLLDLETAPHAVRRLVRRRLLVPLARGVLVEHTGTPTWTQQAWAAVLQVGPPAALAGASALRAVGLDVPGTGFDVVVPLDRRPRGGGSVRVRRRSSYAADVLAVARPPRLRLEVAALDVAAARAAERPDEAAALLGAACQQRLTTPARLRSALEDRPRLVGRAALAPFLEEVAAGSRSALERRWLRDVERAHALPAAERQVHRRRVGRSSYDDVRHPQYGVVVELDGALHHDGVRDRWADLERDLATAADGDLVVRAGWAQALAPCRSADLLARVLATRGWTGTLRRCGPGCSTASVDTSSHQVA